MVKFRKSILVAGFLLTSAMVPLGVSSARAQTTMESLQSSVAIQFANTAYNTDRIDAGLKNTAVTLRTTEQTDNYFASATKLLNGYNQSVNDLLLTYVDLLADGYKKSSPEVELVVASAKKLYNKIDRINEHTRNVIIRSQNAPPSYDVKTKTFTESEFDFSKYEIKTKIIEIPEDLDYFTEMGGGYAKAYRYLQLYKDTRAAYQMLMDYGVQSGGLHVRDLENHIEKTDQKIIDLENFIEAFERFQDDPSTLSENLAQWDDFIAEVMNDDFFSSSGFGYGASMYEIGKGALITQNAMALSVRALSSEYGINLNEYDTATDSFQRLAEKQIQNTLVGTNVDVFKMTIEGQEFTLFLNFETRQALGYGFVGFDEIANDSFMDYGQGVFVGELSEDWLTVSGQFLGVSGSQTLANDYQIDPGGTRAGIDAVGLQFTNIGIGGLYFGRNDTINATILVGDPTNAANNVAQSLQFTSKRGENEPFNLDSGYDLSVGVSTSAVTYTGYGRIVGQDPLDDTDEPSIVMDDLGDLTVTVDRKFNAESFEFSFNGADPQPTSNVAVVSDRIAGAVSDLGNNVLRTGVMFPLEEVDNVNLVHFVDFAEGLFDDNVNTIGYGFGVVGTPTEVADMPGAITATYTGGAAGYYTEHNPFTPTEITGVEPFYGDTSLNVNFGTTAITGTIDIFRRSDDVALHNFTVTGNVAGGNGLTLNLTNGATNTGTGTGSFYGAQAAELAGQFSASDATNKTSTEGVFWGAR